MVTFVSTIDNFAKAYGTKEQIMATFGEVESKKQNSFYCKVVCGIFALSAAGASYVANKILGQSRVRSARVGCSFVAVALGCLWKASKLANEAFSLNRKLVVSEETIMQICDIVKRIVFQKVEKRLNEAELENPCNEQFLEQIREEVGNCFFYNLEAITCEDSDQEARIAIGNRAGSREKILTSFTKINISELSIETDFKERLEKIQKMVNQIYNHTYFVFEKDENQKWKVVLIRNPT